MYNVRMEKVYDIIIIGAGASGIFAATQISQDKSVLVIDASDKKLRKVFVSGGGRCNFTNTNTSEQYYQSQTYFRSGKYLLLPKPMLI